METVEQASHANVWYFLFINLVGFDLTHMSAQCSQGFLRRSGRAFPLCVAIAIPRPWGKLDLHMALMAHGKLKEELAFG